MCLRCKILQLEVWKPMIGDPRRRHSRPKGVLCEWRLPDKPGDCVEAASASERGVPCGDASRRLEHRPGAFPGYHPPWGLSTKTPSFGMGLMSVTHVADTADGRLEAASASERGEIRTLNQRLKRPLLCH